MVSAFAASGLPENFRAPSPALHFFPSIPPGSWPLVYPFAARLSSSPLTIICFLCVASHLLAHAPILCFLFLPYLLCVAAYACAACTGPACWFAALRFSRCISVGCLIRSLKILVRYILFFHTSSNLLRSCRTWRPDLHYPILFFTHCRYSVAGIPTSTAAR